MCCTEEQWSFLIAYPAVSLSIILLWQTVMIRPLRIFSVVLHEFSHAVAVLLTCGTVHDVSVNRFEGGIITWSPRCVAFMKCTFPVIAASGYLGVSVFGTALLLSIGVPPWRFLMLRVFACLLALASLVSLRRAALRFEAACMMLFAMLSFVCSVRPDAVFAWYYILFSSSMLCTYAANDVYDDTIRRSFDDSDASHFAVAVFGDVSKSRFVGRLWYTICVVLHLFGAIITVSRLGGGDDVTLDQVETSRFVVSLWWLLFAAIFSGIDACRLRIPAAQ